METTCSQGSRRGGARGRFVNPASDLDKVSIARTHGRSSAFLPLTGRDAWGSQTPSHTVNIWRS
jgi:hypothetical protein